MATTVKIKFSTGQVGAMSLPDGVNDAYISLAIDKATISWKGTNPEIPPPPEAAWLPVLGWERVNVDHFPGDRTFRSAWRHSGADVVVDMPAAKEICAEKAKLSTSDPAIVAATTPEELKVVLDSKTKGVQK